MCAHIGEVTTLSLYIAVFSCPNLSPPFSLTRLTWKSFNITMQCARISMISFYHLDTARPGSPNARVKTLGSGGPTVIDDLDIHFKKSATDLPACKVIANQIANYTGLNISWGGLTNIASNDFSVLFKYCTYAGKKYSVDDFQPISTVAGRCYTFNKLNSEPGRMAQGTGVRQGLRLQLSPDDQLFSLGRDQGFHVDIYNPDELPQPESEGIAV